MKLRRFSSSTAANTKLHVGRLSSPTSQRVCSVNLRNGEGGEVGVARLLDRRWMLHSPDSKIHQIKLSPLQGQRKDGPFRGFSFSNNADPMLGGGSVMDKKQSQEPFFYVVRDDLLHPLVNGNKARKLDALLPLLEDCGVTDVVTCGGCQSAHAAAVAVSCAERGLKSHLLLRGEQPKLPTGYCLISSLYGEATYVPRSIYANRKNMLVNHANCIAGSAGHVLSCYDILEATTGTSGDMGTILSAADRPRKVVIINEGAGDLVALFGVIRLVKYLCQDHLLGRERPVRLVVDSGTGTTAIGLGVAILCLGLPWKVTAVMLADTIDAYKKKEKDLLSQFSERYGSIHCGPRLDRSDHGIVQWEQRHHQRKFGNVLEGEIESCSSVARQTGILVDPVYTLAAWETSMQLSLEEEEMDVVMLHTGGTLGMFGLAQRYSTHFHEPRSRQAAT